MKTQDEFFCKSHPIGMYEIASFGGFTNAQAT
jgi:hypothetical protein